MPQADIRNPEPFLYNSASTAPQVTVEGNVHQSKRLRWDNYDSALQTSTSFYSVNRLSFLFTRTLFLLGQYVTQQKRHLGRVCISYCKHLAIQKKTIEVF
jgi:hypothetical protein